MHDRIAMQQYCHWVSSKRTAHSSPSLMSCLTTHFASWRNAVGLRLRVKAHHQKRLAPGLDFSRLCSRRFDCGHDQLHEGSYGHYPNGSGSWQLGPPPPSLGGSTSWAVTGTDKPSRVPIAETALLLPKRMTPQRWTWRFERRSKRIHLPRPSKALAATLRLALVARNRNGRTHVSHFMKL